MLLPTHPQNVGLTLSVHFSNFDLPLSPPSLPPHISSYECLGSVSLKCVSAHHPYLHTGFFFFSHEGMNLQCIMNQAWIYYMDSSQHTLTSILLSKVFEWNRMKMNLLWICYQLPFYISPPFLSLSAFVGYNQSIVYLAPGPRLSLRRKLSKNYCQIGST